MNTRINLNCVNVLTRFALISVFALSCFSGFALGQGRTQPNLATKAANEVYENRRIEDGMEKDKAAARSKEERMAAVNEAFKRLQLLHNEFMTMMSATELVESSKIATAAEEIRLRAVQLDANLALPAIPKNKSEKEAPAAPDLPLKEQMSAVCSQIRDFVKNVNLSPTDPKAGIQARHDLAAIVQRSDKVIALTKSAEAKK